jgi:predicted dehydrogenase
VIGAGYFGAFHAARYAENPAAQLVAVVDPKPQARAVAERLGVLWLRDVEELPDQVSAVSIVTPLDAHTGSGCRLLERGCDVLLEKPLAPTLFEADLLIDTAARHGRILQIGHLERFNQAAQRVFELVQGRIRYLECQRMSPFLERHAAVNVVLDLMIHDIDLALHWLGRMPEQICARGYSLHGRQIDFAIARLEFSEQVVVQLTASRFGSERVSRMLAVTDDALYSVDLLNRVARCSRRGNGRAPVVCTEVFAMQHTDAPIDPLSLEIGAFLDAIACQSEPLVTGQDGRAALAVALDILSAMAVA